MKPVIECQHCENCAIGYEVGFTGGKLLHCSVMNDYVTDEDGCTMGVEGTPGSLCVDYSIDISQNAAVWGWPDE